MGIVTSDCPSPDIANNRLDSAELSLLLSEKSTLSVHGPDLHCKALQRSFHLLLETINLSGLPFFSTHLQKIIIIYQKKSAL